MIIRNGIICDKNVQKKADLRIENGLIKSVASSLKAQKSEEVIDASGCFILPSVVDLNSSLGMFNQNISKTLHKVEKEAVRGGVGTIVIQPKTPINSEIGLDYLISKSKDLAMSEVCAVVSCIENNDGDKLNNMAIMFKNGAVGGYISSDANPNCIRRAMEYSWMYSKPIFISLENKYLDLGGVINDSSTAFKLGLSPFQGATESTELVKICEMSVNYNSSSVVHSISKKRSIDIIKNIRDKNKHVTFCTDLHFFSLDDSYCIGYNTFAKNCPPLRTIEDNEAIKMAIKSGIISCIASGHTPITIGAKDVAFEDAAFGIESLALFLPICYTNLVMTNLISMKKLTELVSLNPARLIGIEQFGLIKSGYKADIVIFDPNVKLGCEKNQKNDSFNKNPYASKELFGEVRALFKNGIRVSE